MTAICSTSLAVLHLADEIVLGRWGGFALFAGIGSFLYICGVICLVAARWGDLSKGYYVVVKIMWYIVGAGLFLMGTLSWAFALWLVLS